MNLHGGLRGARLGILVWDGADEVMRKDAGLELPTDRAHPARC